MKTKPISSLFAKAFRGFPIDNGLNRQGANRGWVGTARCAVRAAYQRRNVGREACGPSKFVPPAERGRGHRSAMSLPPTFHRAPKKLCLNDHPD